ncbi:hypothetical protein LG293_17010 (plasmid) [Citricoccus nitrophenolicus]
MTTNDHRNRQPKGVSTGGQYATAGKAEAEGISLRRDAGAADTGSPVIPTALDDTDFLLAARLRLESQDLKAYADRFRKLYPEATSIHPVQGHDEVIIYATADLTATKVNTEDDDLYLPVRSALVGDLTVESGWIPLDVIDAEHERAIGVYAKAASSAAEKTSAAAQQEQAERTYASGLGREILIRHRAALAPELGEEPNRAEAEKFVDNDELADVDQFSGAVRVALDGATDAGGVPNTWDLAERIYIEDSVSRGGDRRKATEMWQGMPISERRFWTAATTEAVELVPGATPNPAGALEVANGAYANTYIGSDGTPVLELNTDTGYSGPVRVHINDGTVYDGNPEES